MGVFGKGGIFELFPGWNVKICEGLLKFLDWVQNYIKRV